ncbi:hypothetical protein [Chengkuizengella sediminis]|uniref:hypothetical protein n=1 Tax=Chengkuizengella sediminis TaxID=1885917 RepID=UPI001389F14A|nr:hypothetical protein [Chengkuizengella sediminis]NDI34941.1 hypothetical protein [Chengkuizengella sediminis]
MKKMLIVLLLLPTLILGACSNGIDVSMNDLPVTKLSGSFSIDVNDLTQIVGDADYVFVAEITDEVETLYKDPVTIETKNGSKEVSDPYTKYSIMVVDNIKGKLKGNKKFDILKAGGISQDQESIVLYEDDELLQVGKYYIIAAYAQPDGSLLVSGPNSSSVLTETSKSKIVSSKEYKEYKEAFKNEFKSDRKRFKSSQEI